MDTLAPSGFCWDVHPHRPNFADRVARDLREGIESRKSIEWRPPLRAFDYDPTAVAGNKP